MAYANKHSIGNKDNSNLNSLRKDYPEDPPPQPKSGIIVNIKLAGYEELKAQLNDIESQIDRIAKKAEKLNIPVEQKQPPPKPELSRTRTIGK